MHCMVDVTNHLNTLNKDPREKRTMAQQLLEHASVFEGKLTVSLRDRHGVETPIGLSHSAAPLPSRHLATPPLPLKPSLTCRPGHTALCGASSSIKLISNTAISEEMQHSGTKQAG
ncbi:unnamed protein product [Pleuronectes platessa]|uniref:Uncharacterized protein n=1 Tax=Pleuronectes platessa TaxID=8262 RepID=A0A9N7Z2K9_PLEPL|nr:unnamed protein product [Pleuronectes platessa]